MNKADTNQFAALEMPYKARALARAQVQADAEALAIAERVEADAAAMAQRAEKGVLDKEDESAAALAAQMLAGGKAIEITVDEQLMLASTVAQSRAKLASKAAAKLREKHAKSAEDLRTAEAAVLAAADAILEGEDVELARQLSHHLSEAVRLGKSLLFSTIASEMTDRKAAPPQVTAVLEKLDLPLIDRRNVAINLWREGDLAAHALRATRRASMIAGEGAPVADAAAQHDFLIKS
jgi:hypothetical protein